MASADVVQMISGAALVELRDEWQVADRRHLSNTSMAELLGTGTAAVITGSAALPRTRKSA